MAMNMHALFGPLVVVAAFALGVAFNGCTQSFDVELTCEQFSPSFSAPTQMLPGSSATVSVKFSTPLGARYAVAWSVERGEVLRPNIDVPDGGATSADGSADGPFSPLVEGARTVTYVAPTTTGSAKVVATLTRLEGSDSSAPQTCTFSTPIMITDKLDEADAGADASADDDAGEGGAETGASE